jgi:hypothetical protein
MLSVRRSIKSIRLNTLIVFVDKLLEYGHLPPTVAGGELINSKQEGSNFDVDIYYDGVLSLLNNILDKYEKMD